MATPLDLRLAHSPDPDDAFMWWPLLDLGDGPAIDVGRFRFEAVTDDIEALNARAEHGELEITALSCAQYARVSDRYVLTACGASIGDGYGPKLVARAACPPAALAGRGARIAVPGTRTTAFAALSLLLGPGGFTPVVLPFRSIPEAVGAGEVDAGVVIHEAQLTYERDGLALVADLGAWWTGRTGLPLPLGVNAVRADLEQRGGPGTLEALAAVLRRSVEHALAHRATSIAYARRFAGGLDDALVGRFVDLYVNRWTLDFTARGRAAVETFLREAAGAGLVPDAAPVVVGSAPPR